MPSYEGVRMPGRPRGCLPRENKHWMPGGGVASLGLTACIACISSWLGTSAACLGRADCLEESAASMGLSTCIAYIHPLVGGNTVYLGRIVNCLGNSPDWQGMSPWLGTSAVYLRGVVSPDCLRRSANCLGALSCS